MTISVVLLFILLLVLVGILSFSLLPVDVAAFSVLAILILAKFVSPEEAFAGFASPAIITMCAMFIVGGALKRTGAAELLALWMHRFGGRSFRRTVAIVMFAGAMVSSVMPNVAAATLLLPTVVSLAYQSGIPASQLLMPLAFATMWGGMLTLIGTTPNILAHELLRSDQTHTRPGFEMFTFLPFGAAVVIIGILYFVIWGRKLLPSNEMKRRVEGVDLSALYRLYERIFCLNVPRGSVLSGKSLGELKLGELFHTRIVAIRRGDRTNLTPRVHDRVEVGDTLITRGARVEFELVQLLRGATLRPLSEEERTSLEANLSSAPIVAPVTGNAWLMLTLPAAIERAEQLAQVLRIQILAKVDQGTWTSLPDLTVPLAAGTELAIRGDLETIERMLACSTLEFVTVDPLPKIESNEVGIIEVVLSPRSKLISKTLGEIGFRDSYDFEVLAIWREGKPIRHALGSVALRFGDALLLQGQRRRFSALQEDDDFVVLTAQDQVVARSGRLPLVLAALAFLVVGSFLGILPVHVIAFLAALAVILGGAIRMDEAYRVVEWRLLFFVAALLPFGAALEHQGAVQYLSGLMNAHADGLSPLVFLVFVMIAGCIVSQALDSVFSIVLLGPICMQVSRVLGYEPEPFVMALALGSSIAFMTPFSHRVNLLVMGAGGYTFKDYVRAGTPLTLILLVVIGIMVPALMLP